MADFEKLYTVDDIARMTMLTSRTIRNYLKDGLLSGKKVGGQWRFTQQDIEALFANSSVASDLRSTRRQDLMDFIDGVNTDLDGDIQVCTLVDYYIRDQAAAQAISQKINDLIAKVDSVQQHRFAYEYIEKEAKARYTIFGPPGFAAAALAVVEAEWNRLNAALAKFTDKAVLYAEYRPSYPASLIDFIFSRLGPGTSKKIADIGSGTGKMSGLLLMRGSTVYGVEPNADMRRQAELLFGSQPAFHSVGGTAENTGLPANSVDAIICAEAFHWFDNERSRSEFRRILKPDGWVFLVWNQFSATNAYAADIQALNGELCADYRCPAIHVAKQDRAASLFGAGNFETVHFDNTIRESFAALLGGMLSASFAPRPGDPNEEAYQAGIKRIFDQYSQDQQIETIFDTVCFCGQLPAGAETAQPD